MLSDNLCGHLTKFGASLWSVEGASCSGVAWGEVSSVTVPCLATHARTAHQWTPINPIAPPLSSIVLSSLPLRPLRMVDPRTGRACHGQVTTCPCPSETKTTSSYLLRLYTCTPRGTWQDEREHGVRVVGGRPSLRKWASYVPWYWTKHY